MGWNDRCEVYELLGKTLTRAEVVDGEIRFAADDGSQYRMFHEQDCCEHVAIEDVNGDWNDLIGSPLTLAEETTSGENPPDYVPGEYGQDSFTWTFYRFATVKGYVNVRWYGESNGYYSESVDFERVPA